MADLDTPNPQGGFTPSEREILAEWFKKHWKNPICPVCGSRKWTGSDHVVQPITQWPVGTANLGGVVPIYPVVLVTCMTCAYVMHFNAVVIGLIQGRATPTVEAANVKK